MPRGGYRRGAGRKPKYPEHGSTKAVRVPVDLVDEIEAAIAQRKLFIQREAVEKLSTELNMLLLSWNRKTDEEKRERVRNVSRALGELIRVQRSRTPKPTRTG